MIFGTKSWWNARLREGELPALMNYPDLEVFRPHGRTRDDGRFVMIYPGSLNWHQGLDIALRAFALIKDDAPGSEFHIYGTGPALDDLVALVKELGLESRVRFAGILPLREIARVIENADLGVVPKRKNAFGNEAFSTNFSIHGDGSACPGVGHKDRHLLLQSIGREIFSRRER